MKRRAPRALCTDEKVKSLMDLTTRTVCVDGIVVNDEIVGTAGGNGSQSGNVWMLFRHRVCFNLDDYVSPK